MGTRWFGYELVVGMSWSGYELVLGTSWVGLGTSWQGTTWLRYELTGNHLGYRFPTRTLNPNPNLKTDPNPNTNPKSDNNLCRAKRHPNKVQDSVINTSYFVQQGVGA